MLPKESVCTHIRNIDNWEKKHFFIWGDIISLHIELLWQITPSRRLRCCTHVLNHGQNSVLYHLTFCCKTGPIWPTKSIVAILFVFLNCVILRTHITYSLPGLTDDVPMSPNTFHPDVEGLITVLKNLLQGWLCLKARWVSNSFDIHYFLLFGRFTSKTI